MDQGRTRAQAGAHGPGPDPGPMGHGHGTGPGPMDQGRTQAQAGAHGPGPDPSPMGQGHGPGPGPMDRAIIPEAANAADLKGGCGAPPRKGLNFFSAVQAMPEECTVSSRYIDFGRTLTDLGKSTLINSCYREANQTKLLDPLSNLAKLI